MSEFFGGESTVFIDKAPPQYFSNSQMDLNKLTEILLGTLRAETQKVSEEALKSAEQSNLPEFVRALATLIADPSRDKMAVRVAGVILKNQFYDSRSEAGLKRKYQIWNTAVPEPIRQHVRDCVLRALVSPSDEARKSASQIVAALGVLELGERRWPEMIGTLCANAANKEMPDAIKVHSLEAMGFLCETLSPDLVSEQMTNELLTAIVSNMQVDKNSIIRLAAVKALNDTLAFAVANMNRTVERDYIVTNICECARADRNDIRYAAFDCMTTLAHLYYHLLNAQYMDAFFQLTVAAVKAAGAMDQNAPQFEETEKVALHAIEFWCALCEQEMELNEELIHAQSSGLEVDPQRQSQKFIEKAMGVLIELVTTCCLIKQAEELSEDEDDWNLAMSGGTLLGLIAQCEPQHILRFIMPFVQKNLPLMGPNNWRQREAGLMAFGKCLNGPPSSDLSPFIRQGLDFFLSLLDPSKETVPHVRDTAAWVIGTVCELHIETIIEVLPSIVNALVSVLNDPVAIVAAKGAVAIQHLARAFEDSREEPTNKLSPFLPTILPRLMETTSRPDWEDGELRGHCFEAMNAVVGSCASDGFPIVASLLEAIIAKLSMAMQTQVTTQAQRDEIQAVMGNCCGTILVIIQRLRTQVQPHAETIMTLVVRIMENVHHGATLMDAHLVVGAMATALGLGFNKFYKTIVPFVIRGIENSEDYQTCQTATELVSDISRAINKHMAQELPAIMLLMLRNLANEELHRSVKPTTFSAIADVALALQAHFLPYAESVLATLDAASLLSVPRDDPDLVDYLNEIRESVLECYTAIILALRPAALQLFAGRIDHILNFLANVCREGAYPDSDVTEDVLKGAVGLLGDVCILSNEIRAKVRPVFAQVFKPAVDLCAGSDDDEVKAVAKTCMKLMQ